MFSDEMYCTTRGVPKAKPRPVGPDGPWGLGVLMDSVISIPRSCRLCGDAVNVVDAFHGS